MVLIQQIQFTMFQIQQVPFTMLMIQQVLFTMPSIQQVQFILLVSITGPEREVDTPEFFRGLTAFEGPQRGP